MIYRLVILNGPRKGEQITVPNDPVTMGRGKECSLSIADAEMASAHAELQHGTEGLHIRDLGTMNRILLNNRPKDEAYLRHGDMLEIGRTRFLVQAGVEAEVTRHNVAFKRWRPSFSFVFIPVLLVGALLTYWITQLAVEPEIDIATPLGLRSPPMPKMQPTPAAVVKAAPPEPMPEVSAPGPEAATTPATVAKPAQPPAPDLDEALAAAIAEEAKRTTAAAALDRTLELRLSEARELIAEDQLVEADRLLESIEIMAPAFIPATMERAALFEARGMLDPAMQQWQQARTGSTDAQLRATADAAIARLSLARTQQEPAFTGHVKLVDTEATRFPATDEYVDMRVIDVTLQRPRSRDAFLPEGVKAEVIFFDVLPTQKAIALSKAISPRTTLKATPPWNPGEKQTLTATYLVRKDQVAQQADQRRYYGYLVVVTYFGAIQEVAAQPRSLLKKVELQALTAKKFIASGPDTP